MWRDRPGLLLIGGWVVVAAHATVFTWLTAWSYARIAFTADAREQAVTASNCRTDPACAVSASAHIEAQLAAMDNVVLVVRGSALLITVVSAALLAVVTVLVAVGRSGAAGRMLGGAWVAQAVLTVSLFVVYVLLLLRGQSVLGDIPQLGRMPTADSSFSAALTDVGNLYYVGWFVVMNGAVLSVFRTLSRSLSAPAKSPATS